MPSTSEVENQITPVGSRPGRRNVRVLMLEGPASLKQRLDTFSFETGMSLADFARYALWTALADAEANPVKFRHKVADMKAEMYQEEKVQTKC